MLLVLAGLALAVLSPLGLRVFGGENKEWERLSLIGQTYGAISALIAVLALLGVVATLVYQARELRRAADESRRQAMGDLLRMAMADPDLDECWGPVEGEDDARSRKQLMYTNMIVTQWGTSFRAGATPEKRLRANAVEMFRGAGRPGLLGKRPAQPPELPGEQGGGQVQPDPGRGLPHGPGLHPAPGAKDGTSKP